MSRARRIGFGDFLNVESLGARQETFEDHGEPGIKIAQAVGERAGFADDLLKFFRGQRTAEKTLADVAKELGRARTIGGFFTGRFARDEKLPAFRRDNHVGDVRRRTLIEFHLGFVDGVVSGAGRNQPFGALKRREADIRQNVRSKDASDRLEVLFLRYEAQPRLRCGDLRFPHDLRRLFFRRRRRRAAGCETASHQQNDVEHPHVMHPRFSPNHRLQPGFRSIAQRHLYEVAKYN